MKIRKQGMETFFNLLGMAEGFLQSFLGQEVTENIGINPKKL